jgi:hypothetical protein
MDKRYISDFIADYFPDLKMGNMTHNASHAEIYYELLRNIPPDAKVKTVIVTLNMRSFNADWIHSKLETPLQKSLVMLKDRPSFWNRFLLSFKGYDIKTEKERSKPIDRERKRLILYLPYSDRYTTVKEWDKAMATEGIKTEDGNYDYVLTPLACHYIKTYAFQIDTLTNPRIKDFDKIVNLAKQRNWNLIFNLMAENVEMADSLVGKDVIFFMEKNRDILVERYQRKGVTVVDNLSSVEDKEYLDRDWTTEHYAERGRKIIARNVAQSLKTLYPNDYRKVAYSIDSIRSIEKQTTFFNNCDEDTPWGQRHTITDENAFSGEKSSKTGQGEYYGLTFEYGIKNLPNPLQAVDIEMQIFQKDLNHNAEILMEVTIADSKHLSSFPIQNATTVVDEWQKVSCRFELERNFHRGNIVKVFLYNTSNTIIYCDDILVKFE